MSVLSQLACAVAAVAFLAGCARLVYRHGGFYQQPGESAPLTAPSDVEDGQS